MLILPSSVFAPNNFNLRKEECYAVHFCNGSWRTKRYSFVNFLVTNNLLRRLLGKRPVISLAEAIKGNF